MKKFLIAGALGATALGGFAYAAQPAATSNGARPMGDGVMTREEAQSQADKRFDRLDFNRDGKVSEETMMAARADGRGQGMRGRHSGNRMRGQGMNRGPDGVARTRGDRGPAGEATAAAPRPDRAARGAQRQARAHESFVKLDTNRDGQLDRAEFRAQATVRFTMLDANNDGRVDAAERFAGRAKMREQMRQMRGAPASTPTPGA
jgi:hypothetical protein